MEITVAATPDRLGETNPLRQLKIYTMSRAILGMDFLWCQQKYRVPLAEMAMLAFYYQDRSQKVVSTHPHVLQTLPE